MSIENNGVERDIVITSGPTAKEAIKNTSAVLFDTGKSAAQLVAEGADRKALEKREFQMLDLITEPKPEFDLMPLSEADKAKMQAQCEDIRKYLDEHPELA